MERDWAAQLPIRDTPLHWREAFGGEELYRLHVYRAAGDHLRTYWREHWTFGNVSEPPYPFYVFARDDDPGRKVLRRLDEIGLPYHLELVTDESSPLTDYPQLIAPLWYESVEADEEWSGRAFTTMDELEEFFGFFRPRT